MARWLSISLVSLTLLLTQTAAYSKATVVAPKKATTKVKESVQAKKPLVKHEVEAKADDIKLQPGETVIETEVKTHSSVIEPAEEFRALEGVLYTFSDESV